MSCASIRNLLSPFVDSELSPDEMQAVRGHLFACDECAREHAGLVAAKGRLASLARVEPDEELMRFIACKPWETGAERLESRGLLPGRTGWRRAMHSKALSVAAAATLFAVSVGVGLTMAGAQHAVQVASIAESLKAEHQRYRSTSPLAGGPDSAQTAEAARNDAFVTFVSKETIH